MNKKEKSYGLLKGILIFIVIAIVLSWLIPTGYYSGSEFVTEGTLTRIGLNDLSWIVDYAVMYLVLDKFLFLMVVGGLYGVITKTGAYKNMVTKIANKFSKNKKVAVVLFSIILACLASLLTQVYAIIIFIPFIISILNAMKLDKMTIFATTFGSLLVGILGATFGTDGANYLINYLLVEGQTAHEFIFQTVLVRAGILAIGLILFNYFTLSHMNRVSKKEEVEGVDLFPVEDVDTNKRTSKLPIIILGIITLLVAVIGYIDWTNAFNVNLFTNIHESIYNFKLGDSFYIFKDLLGGDLEALGSWVDLLPIVPILLLFTIVLGLCYRMKFSEFIDNFVSGAKKFLVPSLVILGAYTMFFTVYMSPYVATILNKILSLTDGFNLATMTLASFITNIFHIDLGYSGYILGANILANYVDYVNPIYVILTTTYGLVQFFIPTSVILGIGLTTLKVKYTDWLKYIAKFILGMFICLLIVFILLTLI